MVDDQLKRKRHAEEEEQSKQENNKIDAHTALANKVYVIRTTLNKEPAAWIVAQTITMVMWYKQAGDLPLPTTKQLLLTRYYA